MSGEEKGHRISPMYNSIKPPEDKEKENYKTKKVP